MIGLHPNDEEGLKLSKIAAGDSLSDQEVFHPQPSTLNPQPSTLNPRSPTRR